MPSLKQLEYFIALARNNNMSKLSEENYISQTALSNSISRLEQELGVKLFDRVGRNIVLNDYGKLYLQHIEPALVSIRCARIAIENAARGDHNNVSVAIASSTLWGNLIGSFLTKNPQYSISQKECNIDAIMERLPELETDLIIAGTIDFNSPSLDSVMFIKDPVRLYVPPDHPFAGRKSIHLSEAKNEKFICQPKTSGFSRFSNILFRKAGFTPNIVAECDYSLRRDLLRSGVGVVLASDSVLRAHFFDNCVAVLIEDEWAYREMSCFWLKNRPLSVAAIAFRDFLIEYYRDTSNKA